MKLKSKKFDDQIDEIADHLNDIVGDFIVERLKLITQLDDLKQKFDKEILDIELWTIKNNLVPDDKWFDENEFLPYIRTEIIITTIPDMGVIFKEKVAQLKDEIDNE